MAPTIAALQYAALMRAWAAARMARRFSQKDEADWAEVMDELWWKMTPEEQRSIEAEIEAGKAVNPDAWGWTTEPPEAG